MTAPTPRKVMSPRRRHHIFHENAGICCLCGVKIDQRAEEWRIEHIIPLGLGGKDTNPNCGPAHLECARKKDKDDMRLIAKAKRVQERHEGRKRSTGFYRPENAVYDWKRRRYVICA